MRLRNYLFAVLAVLFSLDSLVSAQAPSQYVLIGWNELGMHCISPRFSEMAILPPYNTIQATVIRRAGEEPRVLTSGVTVKYAIDNPAGMVESTDFWKYAQKLFGKSLAPGIGLTGNGYSGTMVASGGRFVATGIPVLPYNKTATGTVWQPYQTATLSAYVGSTLVGTQKIVVPVSDEMHCNNCHKKGGVADAGLTASTPESYILALHDKREGTTLMSKKPVLCASCHADAALGTAGTSGVKSLSYAMHVKHSSLKTQPGCYDCHPGANTQCNRSAISGMGPVGTDPKCATCHGNLTKMATDLKAGRKPWVQEPNCAQCHGSTYSTGTTLFRNAKGHGGVACIACHNSPHAWWPSKNALDNLEPLKLQKNNHAIGYNACNVCHTDGRKGTVPPHKDD